MARDSTKAVAGRAAASVDLQDQGHAGDTSDDVGAWLVC